MSAVGMNTAKAVAEVGRTQEVRKAAQVAKEVASSVTKPSVEADGAEILANQNRVQVKLNKQKMVGTSSEWEHGGRYDSEPDMDDYDF